MIKFNGEYVSAETGEEVNFGGQLLWWVTEKIRKMKDGDTMVINATEESEGGI